MYTYMYMCMRTPGFALDVQWLSFILLLDGDWPDPLPSETAIWRPLPRWQHTLLEDGENTEYML